MPRFALFDLVKWLHFVCVSTAGGAAVVALMISGLEDEREDLRGLAASLWKKVAANGFRLAAATGRAPLIVAHVDVTRFVTYEDPGGYVHTAPIDLDNSAGEAQLARVREAATAALGGAGVEWTTAQLVGDPALALKHLAEQADARLIVVGTRRRGFGETVREFFTGSVAARLAHRQSRPVLVVPLDDPVQGNDDPWAETWPQA